MWHSGSGIKTNLDTIYKQIESHTRKNGSVYVGCDSQIYGDKCTFSTVICLHGANNQKGGYYFFKRQKTKRNDYPNMVIRLLKEVELSIAIGYKILENNPSADIEIHIDANSKKDQPTGRFADMLMGYAKGAGFRCKIKPEAWASNSIADKHSK
tara:strand:+ start:596 stop:1057 length:462 start_codon:yes stop_codon:yes gene_type:complete